MRSRSAAAGVGAAARAERDVGGDGVVEEHDVLAHERELAPQRGDVPRRERLAVEQQRAGGRLDEARQQVDERRLARARRADERDRLAGAQLEVDAVERRRLRRLR